MACMHVGHSPSPKQGLSIRERCRIMNRNPSLTNAKCNERRSKKMNNSCSPRSPVRLSVIGAARTVLTKTAAAAPSSKPLIRPLALSQSLLARPRARRGVKKKEIMSSSSTDHRSAVPCTRSIFNSRQGRRIQNLTWL